MPNIQKLSASLLIGVSLVSQAQTDWACSDAHSLKKFDGQYTSRTLLKELVKTRSLPFALAATKEHETGYIVSDKNVYPNLGWHESSPSELCIQKKNRMFWFREKDSTKVDGPYQYVASLHQSLSTVFMNRLRLLGCFQSNANEKWCITPSLIQIDKQNLTYRLQLDTSEVPEYGTALHISDAKIPFHFFVFVPAGQAWHVYQDDWVTLEGRKQVEVGVTKPWRVLTPIANKK